MKTTASSRPLTLALLALCGFFAVTTATPVQAQDGLVMRNIFGKLGLLPEEKDPIEYRERPGLVVPKDTGKLRQPEDQPVQARAGGQWPVDPDVEARKREQARRNQPVFFPLKADAEEGGRLKLNELAAGRSAKGVQMGESGVPKNDKDGVRLSIQEMTAGDKQARMPSYAPGTEPPRKFLTDPPVGLRIPSAGAPVGKRTGEDPTVDSLKVDNAWRRLD
ncbi:MAG: hypothetical protein FD175_542 [Beijerinckiaceae bacterium]|nr:MAG: hypothetical protein FD175_542 [Beijerinckiaceae bacterium]